jgi:MFS family permease
VYTKPFLLLTLVSFLTFGILNVYNLLPLYLHALGGREAEIGRIRALYHVAAILCQAATAGLLDRWPRRPVLLIGTIALTAASFAFALTTRRPSFGLASALLGLGTMIFWRNSRAARPLPGRPSGAAPKAT